MFLEWTERSVREQYANIIACLILVMEVVPNCAVTLEQSQLQKSQHRLSCLTGVTAADQGDKVWWLPWQHCCHYTVSCVWLLWQHLMMFGKGWRRDVTACLFELVKLADCVLQLTSDCRVKEWTFVKLFLVIYLRKHSASHSQSCRISLLRLFQGLLRPPRQFTVLHQPDKTVVRVSAAKIVSEKVSCCCFVLPPHTYRWWWSWLTT